MRRILVTVFLLAGSLLVGAVPATAAATLPVVAVTASADDGNVPGNAVDGNAATRWSGEGDGVWIRFDLGAATTVGSLLLSWYQGDARTFTVDVQLSADGTSWSTVLARKVSGGSTAGPEAYDFADASARTCGSSGTATPRTTGPASPRRPSSDPAPGAAGPAATRPTCWTCGTGTSGCRPARRRARRT